MRRRRGTLQIVRVAWTGGWGSWVEVVLTSGAGEWGEGGATARGGWGVGSEGIRVVPSKDGQMTTLLIKISGLFLFA